MMKYISISILCIVFSVLGTHYSSLLAQVTIGSNKDASPGALLDLKESNSTGGNANSKRGLALPRVDLTDKNNLYPMFEDPQNAGSPTAEYAGANKAEQDNVHTGLLVYNLNSCQGFGRGTYVWVGNEWLPLHDVIFTNSYIGIPTASTKYEWVNSNTVLIHLPSGKDLRAFPADKKFNFTVEWRNSSMGGLYRKNVTQTIDGGLKFANSSQPDNWTNPVTTSPVIFNYYIDNMSDIITSDNFSDSGGYPFRSRETSVTFETPLDECNENTQITVRLNQTNFKMLISPYNGELQNRGFRFRTKTELYPSATGINHFRYLITNKRPAIVDYTNAAWESTYIETNAGIINKNNIGVPATGGTDIIDGSPALYFERNPQYVAADNALNRNREAGILVYTDTAAVARYYPSEIHIVQCSVPHSEEPINAPSNETQWGTQVLKHTDQQGQPFYSAYFGSAGRWMITNLAATVYASGSGVTTKSLAVFAELPYTNFASGKGKYAYPQTGEVNFPPGTVPASNWGKAPADWRWEEGLLYNWFAATGRDYNEGYTVNEGNSDHTRVQGICPDGWYLPSDKDWNELEKEIYENIDKYSSYDAVDVSSWKTAKAAGWNSSWNTASKVYRGDPIENHHLGHGAAMKEICPLSDGTFFAYLEATKNYSKEIKSGGFNVSLVGRIGFASDSAPTLYFRDRGWDVNYWTSSQLNAYDSWERSFQLEQGGVRRETVVKTRLSSVRCKKR